MARQLPAMCPSCLRYQLVPPGSGPAIRFACEFCQAEIGCYDAARDPLVAKVRQAAQAGGGRGVSAARRWFGL